MEKKKKNTINPFLKHRLKKQGAGAKPRQSFMISSLKENKQGTFRFQIILPPKPLSLLLLMSNIILYPRQETFVSKIPSKILTFTSIHSWREMKLDEL